MSVVMYWRQGSLQEETNWSEQKQKCLRETAELPVHHMLGAKQNLQMAIKAAYLVVQRHLDP